jgi:hypothetical protein
MILTIITWACLGVLLQVAEPILLIKREFGFKEEEYDEYSKWRKFLHRLLYCAKCLTFWVALSFTWDIQVAIISSILAGLIEKWIW